MLWIKEVGWLWHQVSLIKYINLTSVGTSFNTVSTDVTD